MTTWNHENQANAGMRPWQDEGRRSLFAAQTHSTDPPMRSDARQHGNVMMAPRPWQPDSGCFGSCCEPPLLTTISKHLCLLFLFDVALLLNLLFVRSRPCFMQTIQRCFHLWRLHDFHSELLCKKVFSSQLILLIRNNSGCGSFLVLKILLDVHRIVHFLLFLAASNTIKWGGF